MIAVIHPCVRVKSQRQVVKWWQSRAAGNDWQYVMCMHAESAKQVGYGIRGGIHGVSLPITACDEIHWWANDMPDHPTLNGRSSYVGNTNFAANKSIGDILVLATDDLEPPQDWDRLIQEAIPDTSREVILRCDDGGSGDLIRHPIMTRARYERQGWFVCPEYTGMYSDNDLTERGRLDGVIVEAPHIKFRHHHPMIDREAKWDIWYRYGNTADEYRLGKETFLRRKALGFPLG